jgi:hypothetical protein
MVDLFTYGGHSVILVGMLNPVDGQFPIPQWNVYERNVDTRTNNHVEGVKSIVIKLKALSIRPTPLPFPAKGRQYSVYLTLF